MRLVLILALVAVALSSVGCATYDANGVRVIMYDPQDTQRQHDLDKYR